MIVCLVGSRAASASRTATVSGPNLTGDHPDPVLEDAPPDPGDGLAVAGVAVQHPGGQVAAERGAGEPEDPLQAVDHDVASPSRRPVGHSTDPSGYEPVDGLDDPVLVDGVNEVPG
jgi:hypothetical protein